MHKIVILKYYSTPVNISILLLRFYKKYQYCFKIKCRILSSRLLAYSGNNIHKPASILYTKGTALEYMLTYTSVSFCLTMNFEPLTPRSTKNTPKTQKKKSVTQNHNAAESHTHQKHKNQNRKQSIIHQRKKLPQSFLCRSPSLFHPYKVIDL